MNAQEDEWFLSHLPLSRFGKTPKPVYIGRDLNSEHQSLI
jgi:hypothetical protein